MVRTYMNLLKVGMTIQEKTAIIFANPDAELVFTMKKVDLLTEFNQHVADNFKTQIYKMEVVLGRRLTIAEVEESYEKFKIAAMNNENTDDIMTIEYSTRADCMLDLALSYGRYASRILSKRLNEKEEILNRKLSREEVLCEYRAIDEELCRTCLTRQSK
jgi:hypothetical protein